MEGKKHLLVFESQSGTVLTIETDDISEISEQKWFSQFISDAVMLEMKNNSAIPRPPSQMQQQEYVQQQMQQRVQQDPYASSVSPAMQRPQQQMVAPRQESLRPEYLSYTPDGSNGTRKMGEAEWATLTNEQRLEWARYYGIKLG
jgi:hypothetical protein